MSMIRQALQRVAAPEWQGRQGPVDAALLAAVIAEQPHPVFYVVGPPGMVAGVRRSLLDLGVGEDDIRFEEFAGY